MLIQLLWQLNANTPSVRQIDVLPFGPKCFLPRGGGQEENLPFVGETSFGRASFLTMTSSKLLGSKKERTFLSFSPLLLHSCLLLWRQNFRHSRIRILHRIEMDKRRGSGPGQEQRTRTSTSDPQDDNNNNSWLNPWLTEQTVFIYVYG